MPRTPSEDWLMLAHESYWLWFDSMVVIGMRTSDTLVCRPGYEREAALMVSEKVRAHAELGAKLAAGGSLAPEKAARKVVKHYGRKVRANRRRLARRK